MWCLLESKNCPNLRSLLGQFARLLQNKEEDVGEDDDDDLDRHTLESSDKVNWGEERENGHIGEERERERRDGEGSEKY